MRRIPPSRRSHIVGFQPLPSGLVEHESALERDFVTLASFLDPDVSITSQPVTIYYLDGHRRRRYTPDFLVVHAGRCDELIEIKYEADLRMQAASLELAFASAQAWASEKGGTFRVVTEREIRSPLLIHAKRLLPLRDLPIDEKLTEHALAAARSLQAPTFGGVLAAIPDGRAAALTTVWRLIARGRLQIDLSAAAINFDTPIVSA